MPKPKYEPDKPKRIPFTNIYYVRVYPEAQDVWVKARGVFYVAKKSGKRRNNENKDT